MLSADSATSVWRTALRNVLGNGSNVSPRKKKTVELLQHTTIVDMTEPVVASPHRKLSYVYLAAEALWVLSGDDKVSAIAPYNARIAEFSDDGVRFFGAYGPRIVEQLPYVINKLDEDPHTRQAVLTTWRQNPPTTKDVPCTVALAFSLRHEKLNCHTFMRSSDLWLGWPYDVFTFSMVSAVVALRLNLLRRYRQLQPVGIGHLYLTAASSHLYEENWADARACAQESEVLITEPMRQLSDESDLIRALAACRGQDEIESGGCWRIRPRKELP